MLQDAFLQKAVAYIKQNHSSELQHLAIVLPTKRAAIFLKKHLTEQFSPPFWSPSIYSIEDFIRHISPLNIIDTLEQLVELYKCHQTIKPTNKETFEEFSKWASNLLNDFNEIDHYLIDATYLFQSLANIKEIDNWSFHSEELTDFQMQYLNFWKSLGEYYHLFSTSLLKQQKAYQGLAYKEIIKNLNKNFDITPWKNILFVGFNALTKCEETIIDFLTQKGIASTLWDSDEYYLNNKIQEAGKFIRKHKQNSLLYNKKYANKQIYITENLLSTTKKNIQITGTTKGLLQTKIAGEILKNMPPSDYDKTAIVLSDSNLLFPLLHSLPENIENINITMGFPLKNTMITSLSASLFELHEKSKKHPENTLRFYYKDINNIFEHPYIQLLTNSFNTTLFHKHNLIYLSLGEIKELNAVDVEDLLELIFNEWESPQKCIKSLETICNKLIHKLIQERDKQNNLNSIIEIEFINSYKELIGKIDALNAQHQFLNTTIGLSRIMSQLTKSTAIPFEGEPLRGLQIMGLLETQALDFKNIILLSVNENTLPSGKQQQSFIPFDVKQVFKLPTYHDRDAIFAYHFYRLLQRAENIHLIYSTETDGLRTGEKSRFITQIINELPRVNKNTFIHEQFLNIPISANINNSITIEKTADVTELLNKKLRDGISPSAIIAFKNCSLQFYFQQLLKLKEPETIEETIGADILGTIVHQVLFKLYLPYKNEIIDKNSIKKMLQDKDLLLTEALKKEANINEIESGNAILTYTVARRFISNFLNQEIENCNKNELFLKELETTLEYTILVDNSEIKIKGIADRIDVVNGVTRIIDYKTGKAENKELNVKEIGELISNIDLNKSLQLLLYAWLYKNQNSNTIPAQLKAGIISFRELSAGLKPVKVNGNSLITDNILSDFENNLKILLHDLIDPTLPFKQTENTDVCNYCTFKQICHR